MRAPRVLLGWLLPALVATGAAGLLPGAARAAEVQPEATQALRRATDYLAGLQQFRAEMDMSIEYIFSGQKLQYGHRNAVLVQRPNKFRAERIGDLEHKVIYYDGASLAIDLPTQKYHATVAAPPTIDQALDFALEKLNLIAPAADLLYSGAYARLTEGLTSAFVVGTASVGGVACDHLAFQNPEADFQLWIQRGKAPLVRKYVITSKKMPQSPQFMVVIPKWDTAPKVTDAAFSFVPPKDSLKIDFLPTAAAGKN